MVALFWFVIFSYGSNWFALSPMLTTFEKEFNISNWEAHLLISLIGTFVIFFAWPAGSLIDKRGSKISVSLGAFFMALGFGLRPWFINSFDTLLLSSVLAGLGLAWILVALAPQMLRWFPEKQASLPVGIISSGLFIGFGTGSLLTPFLVDVMPRFSVFLMFGILAVLSFILWVLFARDSPPSPPEERKKVEKTKFIPGMKQVFSSKNAYVFPVIGFIIVGLTLVISAFIHFLYPNEIGGYTSGLLLYGCAVGAFSAPFLVKKYSLKRVAMFFVTGAAVFWLIMFTLYDLGFSWFFITLTAFLFGLCFQATWPLALFSQETEKGVTEANVGIAASLYISISNIGAATLPVVFGLIFANKIYTFTLILIGIIICVALWGVVKRK